MATLLGALLRNESGGRNIPNVHQGTTSGQAQGYFQITTGTWDDFGGRKYAANPMGATYEQQAEIASKIPLKRWDPSTIAAMRATGRPVNPSLTLGENLAAHGESFAGGAAAGATPSPSPYTIAGPGGKTAMTQGPIDIRHPPNPAVPTPAGELGGYGLPPPAPGENSPYALPDKPKRTGKDRFKDALQGMAQAGSAMTGAQWQMPNLPGQPGAAIAQAQQQPADPYRDSMRRQQLAMVMQRLNQGSLV